MHISKYQCMCKLDINTLCSLDILIHVQNTREYIDISLYIHVFSDH